MQPVSRKYLVGIRVFLSPGTRAAHSNDTHAEGSPKPRNETTNTAQAHNTQCLIREFSSSEIVPAGTTRPYAPILETYHLRPVPVEHQHTAENILADGRRMNTCGGGDDHATFWSEQPGRVNGINARAGVLEPAQPGCQFAPVGRHIISAQHLGIAQVCRKFIGI